MKPWRVISEAKAPDGGQLVLTERDGEYVIRVDGQWLMSSRTHGSEEAMAEAALPPAALPGDGAGPLHILVGGLGCGYTLRAVLRRVGPRARITVAEISQTVVQWNRGVLGHFAGHPLEDPRVSLELQDVAVVLGRGKLGAKGDRRGGEVAGQGKGGYHAILLDVDNGPQGLTMQGNSALYQGPALAAIGRALRSDGRLVVWSAVPDAPFSKRLRAAGFLVDERTVRATGAGRGARHTLFVASRPGSHGS